MSDRGTRCADLSLGGGPVASAPMARAAYDQLTGLGSYALTANLALELPLGRHAARGARNAARAGLLRAELGEADVQAQIAAAMAEGIAALAAAQRRAQLLVPALAAAALDLEAERARFDTGRGSNFAERPFVAVEVSWQKLGSRQVEITVADEGLGVADTHNLFVPFFTTKPGGNGIGLVLSRQICEAHHGTLSLKSRTDRPGALARLLLPL